MLQLQDEKPLARPPSEGELCCPKHTELIPICMENRILVAVRTVLCKLTVTTMENEISSNQERSSLNLSEQPMKTSGFISLQTTGLGECTFHPWLNIHANSSESTLTASNFEMTCEMSITVDKPGPR